MLADRSDTIGASLWEKVIFVPGVEKSGVAPTAIHVPSLKIKTKGNKSLIRLSGNAQKRLKVICV